MITQHAHLEASVIFPYYIIFTAKLKHLSLPKVVDSEYSSQHVFCQASPQLRASLWKWRFGQLSQAPFVLGLKKNCWLLVLDLQHFGRLSQYMELLVITVIL